jgi:two-component system, LytTR family, sensor kinase
MLKNNRFSFWKVFWVVLAAYVFFLLVGLLGTYTASTSSNEPFNWKYFLDKWHIINQCLNILTGAIFFYFTLNFYYKYFVDRKGFIHFLRLTVIAGAALVFYLFSKDWWLPSSSKVPEKHSQAVMLFASVMFTGIHTVFSLVISYMVYLRDEKKRQKVLEAQKMQLEVEKSSANLNFLKAQINPHFLHNTLNFLYAKSIPYSAELSEGILTLSDIMRYALSEGNTRDGKAPLRDEIEHVWNVIKINQLRFSNKLNVEFNVHGLVGGVKIIPFVLITIVENAFKHGDLLDQEHPIQIALYIDSKRLRFVCRNKKKNGPKELSTGVGLDNIKKRLDLAYGKNYQFNVSDDASFYNTELIIEQL